MTARWERQRPELWPCSLHSPARCARRYSPPHSGRSASSTCLPIQTTRSPTVASSSYNMVQAGKEVAEPLFDGKIMDVLQALIMKAKLDEGNAEMDRILQKVRPMCEHALNYAHEMKVIKTYQEAVQEDEDA